MFDYLSLTQAEHGTRHYNRENLAAPGGKVVSVLLIRGRLKKR